MDGSLLVVGVELVGGNLHVAERLVALVHVLADAVTLLVLALVAVLQCRTTRQVFTLQWSASDARHFVFEAEVVGFACSPPLGLHVFLDLMQSLRHGCR